MNHILKTFLLGLTLLIVPGTAALAQHATPYLTINGGAALSNDMSLEDSAGHYAAEFDTGYSWGGAIGLDLGHSYPQIGTGRIELELTDRVLPLKNASFTTGSDPGDGDLETISIMFNTIAEYAKTSHYGTPYLGLGLGAAQVSLLETTVAELPMIDDDTITFAYQFFTGTTLSLGKRFELDLRYRFFSTLDPKLTDALGRNVETDLGIHDLTVGLRLSF